MKNIKKFFNILGLFIFCLRMIYSGVTLKSDNNYKLDTFVDIWNYCKQWEEGTL